VKHKDLIHILKEAGFFLLRRSKHEIWSNGKGKNIPVPHQKSINKMLVKQIMKQINEVELG
jgi:predicted RNA binding protein YcfA (HicA-like mRNA interferase family)